MQSRQASGFTLIEVAVVLVVIGLLVGGILVGRDLMRMAEIRATIRQIEDFNSAVNAFRNKYNCLPGDCINGSDFGFSPSANGNGDGMIGLCSTALWCNPGGTIDSAQHEFVDFWYHLGQAGLINNSLPEYSTYPDDVTAARAGITTPPAAMASTSSVAGSGLNFPSGWVVRADVRFVEDPFGGDPNGPFNTLSPRNILPKHNLLLGVLATMDPAIPGGSWGAYPVAAIENIDRKIDDGLPRSGQVRAWRTYSFLQSQWYAHTLQVGNSNGHCATADTPSQYNLKPTAIVAGVTTPTSCNVAIKAAF